MPIREQEYGVPDEENPRWTKEMFARGKRLHELPEPLQSKLRALDDARKKRNKVAISIRLSQDVVDGLRASGAGWQSRVDDALRSWLKTQAKAVR